MKLHNCLVNMELECEFVSREENTPLIHEIIKKILKNINEHGSCMLNVGAPGGPSQLLNLKVTPTSLSPETPVVHDYDVPILLVDWTKYPRDAWDLTTRELLKYIDGFNHIARIAELVGVKSHLVKCDVVNLIYYGFAKVIPILAYSDNYGITPKFRKLREDKHFQKDCVRACALPSAQNPPAFNMIYKFVAQLSQGSSSLESVVSRFSSFQERSFCERKLLQFLVLNGILRKIQKYPVFIKDEEGGHDISGKEDYYKEFNGQKHLDEIGVKMGISSRKLEDKFESDPQIFILRK